MFGSGSVFGTIAVNSPALCGYKLPSGSLKALSECSLCGTVFPLHCSLSLWNGFPVAGLPIVGRPATDDFCPVCSSMIDEAGSAAQVTLPVSVQERAVPFLSLMQAVHQLLGCWWAGCRRSIRQSRTHLASLCPLGGCWGYWGSWGYWVHGWWFMGLTGQFGPKPGLHRQEEKAVVCETVPVPFP